jgi:hypothetical protein
MSVTRLNLQAALNRWAGPWAALGDFEEAALYGLRSVGIAPAGSEAVLDADLVQVPVGDMNKLVEIAGWRMLEGIINNLTQADLLRIGVDEDPDKVEARLRRNLDRTYARLKDTYNLDLPALVVGVVDLGTSQVDDPAHPPRNY